MGAAKTVKPIKLAGGKKNPQENPFTDMRPNRPEQTKTKSPKLTKFPGMGGF